MISYEVIVDNVKVRISNGPDWLVLEAYALDRTVFYIEQYQPVSQPSERALASLQNSLARSVQDYEATLLLEKY